MNKKCVCALRLSENFLSLLFHEGVLLRKLRLTSDMHTYVYTYILYYIILYAIYIEYSRSRTVQSSIVRGRT
jgi:hypothetical protein